MEQWLETLEYFDYKCAYCGGNYEVIEHYLPNHKAGTTVSNCVPACSSCNVMKDKYGHDLSFIFLSKRKCNSVHPEQGSENIFSHPQISGFKKGLCDFIL
jgi:hypothetical protein